MYVVFMFNTKLNEASNILSRHNSKEEAADEADRLRQDGFPAFYARYSEYQSFFGGSKTPEIFYYLCEEDLDHVLEDSGLSLTEEQKADLMDYMKDMEIPWYDYIKEEIRFWMEERKGSFS